MSNPPSILFVLPWDLSAAGGVNQVVINLAREAARRNRLRPIIFSMDWSQPDWRYEEIDGIEWVRGRLRAPFGDEQSLRYLAAFVRCIQTEMRFWQDFLDGRNVQMINLHYPVLDYFVFALMRALGRSTQRQIVSIHGTDIANIRQLRGIKRATMLWMMRRADGIVACSEDLCRRARDTLGVSDARLHTIANGVDLDELERSKRSAFGPRIGEHAGYLVNVGAYEYKKGQDLLLRAYKQLRDKGLDSALVMIGRHTPYLQTLQDLVKEMQLEGHVFFLPDLDHQDALSVIRQARMLVQSSREEAFGIALLEAGYLTTPIVAVSTGGIPEVVGPQYPFLVEPNAPAALASMIDAALRDEEKREQCVRLMRERVTAQFTWDQAYSAYESLWRQRN